MKNVCHRDIVNPSQSLIKWGIDNESIAGSQLLAIFTNSESHENLKLIESGLHTSTEFPFIAASPDGIISCDCCGCGCVEVKCPYSIKDEFITANCDFLTRSGEDNALRLDLEHKLYYQVQTQMGVTGTDFCYIIVWTNMDIHVELIEFDSNFNDIICLKASQFFKQQYCLSLLESFTQGFQDLVVNLVPFATSIGPYQPLLTVGSEQHRS